LDAGKLPDVFVHPSWKNTNLNDVASAWYQREITIPAEWTGRRIAIRAEYVNSFATMYVDGKKAGDIRFPGGELDLTALCPPGNTRSPYSSWPLATPSTKGRERPSTAARTVWRCLPQRHAAAARIADVKVDTSVRKGEITIEAALDGLAADAQYVLRASSWTTTAPPGNSRASPSGAAT